MTLFHKHDWKFVGVGHGEFIKTGGDITQLKYRCSCGKVRDEIINGHWTNKELGLEDDPA